MKNIGVAGAKARAKYTREDKVETRSPIYHTKRNRIAKITCLICEKEGNDFHFDIPSRSGTGLPGGSEFSPQSYRTKMDVHVLAHLKGRLHVFRKEQEPYAVVDNIPVPAERQAPVYTAITKANHEANLDVFGPERMVGDATDEFKALLEDLQGLSELSSDDNFILLCGVAIKAVDLMVRQDRRLNNVERKQRELDAKQLAIEKLWED